MKLGGSGSFRVSGGVVGRLDFRVGVSASYSYFRRVRNFDFVYTAAVSVPLAKKIKLIDYRSAQMAWTAKLAKEITIGPSIRQISCLDFGETFSR